MEYRARRDLYYPVDTAIIARIVAGEDMPFSKRGVERHVRPGELVVGLPAEKIAGLLGAGWIYAVPEAPVPTVTVVLQGTPPQQDQGAVGTAIESPVAGTEGST